MAITRGMDAGGEEPKDGASALGAGRSTPEDAAASDEARGPSSVQLRAGSYSHVARRSSRGMPAVAAVSVENVPKSVRPIGAPISKRPPVPPPLPSLARNAESIPPDGPPTERTALPPHSVRPPAPEPFSADAEPESIAQTFDRLLGRELESSFAAMKKDDAAPAVDEAPRSAPPASLEEVRALFAQLAAQHVRPVRDFLIDLRWGEASRDWLPVATGAVQSLRRAAQKLDLADLLVALDEFAGGLAQADAEAAPIVEGAARDRILRGHDALTLVLPDAFALDRDHAQRESIIVHSLLVQIPDVRKVTLDRIASAGLHAIDQFVVAKPDELAQAAGIPLDTAARVVEAFRAHRAEVHATSPDAAHTRERARVVVLVAELEALHTAFERASSAWTIEAAEEKKRTRRARQQTLSQITVLLARLGEVARVDEIERLPFDRKLDAIRAWLREQAAPEFTT